MPKVHVQKSIFINKSKEEVYKVVNDFHTWNKWSPWLILEDNVNVNVQSDGKKYDWSGDLVGSGKMVVTKEIENKKVEYDLNFIKPFKSYAQITFELRSKENGTEVLWTMDTKLPFFMFWMKTKMEFFLGMDYDRGLQLLKDWCEDGKVHSELNFIGNEVMPSTKYIGIKTDCKLDDLGKNMEKDYSELMTFMHEKYKTLISGPAFSIYHKWDPIKGEASYSACIPVSSTPASLANRMWSAQLPEQKMFSIVHKGPYRHSANVWTAQMMRERAKTFKRNKNVDPIEIYLNSPKETPETELISKVLMPIV
jgi:effector-binding domain-containing protein